MTARPVRDALTVHGLFFALAIPLALLSPRQQLGLVVAGLAVLYNLVLPLTGLWRGNRAWVRLWTFLLPLSVTLPCADWMLSVRMQTLVFPDHGIARLGGAVPLYFCGLWIMLLWPLCWLAGQRRHPYGFIAVASLAAFLIWEWAARPMALWHAVGVREVAGFALYPLIPEVLLSLAAFWMWRHQGQAPWPQRVVAALSVTVFYAGALALALLWIG